MSDQTNTSSALSRLCAALVSAAPSNPKIVRQAGLAHLTFGLAGVDTAEARWIRVDDGALTGGAGSADTRFTFEGADAVWDELARGMPINRLVRQGRIVISGDARACVQNWLLVHEIFATTRKAR